MHAKHSIQCIECKTDDRCERNAKQICATFSKKHENPHTDIHLNRNVHFSTSIFCNEKKDQRNIRKFVKKSSLEEDNAKSKQNNKEPKERFATRSQRPYNALSSSCVLSSWVFLWLVRRINVVCSLHILHNFSMNVLFQI